MNQWNENLREKIVPVIISVDHYNALGVIRNLGEKGLKSIVIIYGVDNKRPFVSYSRYIQEWYQYSEENKKSIITKIEEFAGEYADKKFFLFPLDDEIALLLDEHVNSFPSNCIAPNMKGVMRKFLNKTTQKSLASKYDIAIAEDMVLRLDETEITNQMITDWKCYPCIIKPLQSIDGKKSDISVANNEKELQDICNQFQKLTYTVLMVERYIDATDSQMIEMLGYSTGKEVMITTYLEKVREYPIKNGSTSFAYICTCSDEKVCEGIKKLIQETGYKGLFDVEFKREKGTMFFLEINFRNGAPGYASRFVGRNTPFEWIYTCVGNESIKGKDDNLQDKMYFMCEQYDFFNMLKGEVSLFNWIVQYFKSQKVFMRLNDVKPSIVFYYRTILALIKR